MTHGQELREVIAGGKAGTGERGTLSDENMGRRPRIIIVPLSSEKWEGEWGGNVSGILGDGESMRCHCWKGSEQH